MQWHVYAIQEHEGDKLYITQQEAASSGQFCVHG